MQINVTTATKVSSTTLQNVSAYPNPVAGKLNIRTTFNSEYSVQITDLTGNVRIEKAGLHSESSIDVGKLRPGVYLVKIFTSDKTIIKKIIKKVNIE